MCLLLHRALMTSLLSCHQAKLAEILLLRSQGRLPARCLAKVGSLWWEESLQGQPIFICPSCLSQAQLKHIKNTNV